MEEYLAFFTLEPINSVRQMKLGLSNDHYLINDRYLLRVPKKPLRYDLSPANEKLMETALGALIHPSIPLLAFDAQRNLKITPYIQGFHEFDAQQASLTTYQEIAHLLRKMHQTAISGLQKFDGLDRCYQYRKRAKINPHPKEKAIIDNYLLFLSDQQVPCHHDLVSGNILLFSDHVEIIDLEYGGYDDPYFDLASFISENNLKDPDLIKYFLKQYFLTPLTAEHYQKVMAFLQFNDLLWYYWALMMNELYHDDVYLHIAKEKAEHLDDPLHLL